MKKVLSIATVLLLVLALFAGCSKEAQEITIKDQKNSVSATFEKGMTVADLIEQFGISLNAKDEVTPALDTVLEEPVEISIARYAKVNVKIVDATADVESELAEDATDAEEGTTEENEDATDAAQEDTTAAEEAEVIEVELVGGTVADALEKAGIKVDDTITVNFELTAYLSDIEGDIIVTINAKVAEEAATEETATVAEEATTEAATEKETTTARSNDNTTTTTRDYYEDYTTTTRNYYGEDEDTTPVYSEPPTYVQITDPVTAPPMEVITTEPVYTEPDNQGGGQQGGDRTLVSQYWVDDCDGSGGYVVWEYSDGTYETKIYEERPGWI